MKKIKIAIVDDHVVLRAGLRLLLEMQPDMEVIGEAGDGIEAMQMAKENNPDVMLMDITMPRMGGMQAIELITREVSNVRILVLSMHEDPAYIRSSIAAGASGYVVKKVADTELISAIRAVNRGRIFIDSSKSDEDVFTERRSSHHHRNLLSPRESTVLKLLAEGYTHQQVADKIFVSTKTVETYRSRISKKLGLHSRSELVHYALEAGLLNANRAD